MMLSTLYLHAPSSCLSHLAPPEPHLRPLSASDWNCLLLLTLLKQNGNPDVAETSNAEKWVWYLSIYKSKGKAFRA